MFLQLLKRNCPRMRLARHGILLMKHCEKTLCRDLCKGHQSAAGGWLRESRFQKIECLDYGGSFSGICDSRDAFPQKSVGILDLGAIDDGMCALEMQIMVWPASLCQPTAQSSATFLVLARRCIKLGLAVNAVCTVHGSSLGNFTQVFQRWNHGCIQCSWDDRLFHKTIAPAPPRRTLCGCNTRRYCMLGANVSTWSIFISCLEGKLPTTSPVSQPR